MKEGIVPPTINLDNPDIEAGCDLDYVPNVAYTFPAGQIPKAIVSDNLGFGMLHIFSKKCYRHFYQLLNHYN